MWVYIYIYICKYRNVVLVYVVEGNAIYIIIYLHMVVVCTVTLSERPQGHCAQLPNFRVMRGLGGSEKDRHLVESCPSRHFQFSCRGDCSRRLRRRRCPEGGRVDPTLPAAAATEATARPRRCSRRSPAGCRCGTDGSVDEQRSARRGRAARAHGYAGGQAGPSRARAAR